MFAVKIVHYLWWWFLQLGISGWLTGRYNFQCEPVDYTNNPMTLRVS